MAEEGAPLLGIVTPTSSTKLSSLEAAAAGHARADCYPAASRDPQVVPLAGAQACAVCPFVVHAPDG